VYISVAPLVRDKNQHVVSDPTYNYPRNTIYFGVFVVCRLELHRFPFDLQICVPLMMA